MPCLRCHTDSLQFEILTRLSHEHLTLACSLATLELPSQTQHQTTGTHAQSALSHDFSLVGNQLDCLFPGVEAITDNECLIRLSIEQFAFASSHPTLETPGQTKCSDADKHVCPCCHVFMRQFGWESQLKD